MTEPMTYTLPGLPEENGMTTEVATKQDSPLSTHERRRLGELEATIERGVASFMEMGEALREVRDSTLYRATHPTFEAYCRERWGMERAHAYRMIAGAEVVGRLSPVGDKPENERQVRPLLRLEPAQQGEAWEAAVEAAKEEGAKRPTARHVAAAVEQILGTVESEETVTPVGAKGVGLARANEAINALSRIPKDDPFRHRGLQMVTDWVRHNR